MTTVSEIITYGYETPREFIDTIASLKKNRSIHGVSYPFSNKEGLGLFNKASDRILLKSMVYQFLNTQPGERPMLPNYGIDLNQFLFEPLDEQLHTEIVEEVYTSVTTNHPEWEIMKLSVFESNDTNSYKGIPGLVIILNVKLRGDNTSSIEVQTTL